MIRRICIFSTSASSILVQAKLFQSALVNELPRLIDTELIVIPPIYPMPIETFKRIKDCELGVFILDPFYRFNVLSLPKYAFFKFTVDGIQMNNEINTSLRLICERHECFANTEFSKTNLEVNGVKVWGIVMDGIKNIPSPPINPVSDFTMLGLYNHGGNPIMDRKGQNIATALLVKLLHYYDFSVIVGSNVNYLHHVASKYVELIQSKKRKLSNINVSIDEVYYGFGNNLINYDHRLFSYASVDSLISGSINKPGFNFVLIGGLDEVQIRMLYSLSRFFLFPSLTEGFGVPPLEAMNSGRFVIVNSYQTAKELLPSDCSYFIKPSHVTEYMWGNKVAPMLMKYVYPDMDDFTDVITKAVMNGINYDPFKCVQESLRYEYKKSYEPLVKKVMETIK